MIANGILSLNCSILSPITQKIYTPTPWGSIKIWMIYSGGSRLFGLGSTPRLSKPPQLIVVVATGFKVLRSSLLGTIERKAECSENQGLRVTKRALTDLNNNHLQPSGAGDSGFIIGNLYNIISS